MSAAVATGPVPGAASAPSWFEIPTLAARLLWRHWPALLFWYFAQRVAYDLLLDGAIRLAETSVLLSYAAIALLIVTQLIGVMGMFLVLRPSLPTMRGGGGAPDTHASRPWLNVLAIALLPFFAYYASWGLLDGLRRDFMLTYIFSVSFDHREPIGDILQVHGVWLALLVAWCVRYVARWRAAATGHGAWAILATVCEAYWVFVGVAAIAKGLAMARDWWHARVVYVAVAQWWQNPFAGLISLAPLKRALDPAWALLTTAAGAVAMPLIWLAIAAMIYGFDLRRRQRIDDADARLRLLGTRYRNLHLIWRKLADKASAGWTSKGVPIVNSLRLVLRAGLPALLTLCLCWQLLAFADASLWRLAVRWIGAHDWQTWQVLGQPISLLFNGPLSLRPALFTELLRVVLLAATFDRAVARLPRADAAITT